jgi:molecular chaperone GrpE
MEESHNQAELSEEAVAQGTHVESGAEEGAGSSAVEAERVALEKELAESRDRYLRLMADFENFKNRALKEQSELLKYQGERVIVDFLEVLDNLDLALNHSAADAEKLKTGLEMIQKMFVERLSKWGVRGETGMGVVFDPQRHSAISRVPGTDAKPGTIIGELKKAYFYKDKLIRPAEVVVASEAEAN